MSKVRRVDGEGSGNSKGRVRVVFIEMEAKDDTIQESIRALTVALSQGSAQRRAPALPSESLDSQVKSGEIDESAIAGESIEVDAAPQAADNGTKGPRRKPTTPQIVEVKLPPGKQDLEPFLARFKPESQIEKSLVCVAWWTQELGIADVGPNHLYTCFKMMKWTDGPNDFRVPLNDMDRKKEWLAKGERGAWRLSHIGERELARMEAAANTQN